MTTGIWWLDAILLGIGVLSVIFGAVFAVVRTLRPLVHGTAEFLDDWKGEPDRPGVKGRPGVMERLDAYDRRMTAL